MASKRIFVTGLSSAFMRRVAEGLGAEIEITGLSRKTSPPPLSGVHWIKGDLENLKKEALENTDVLIHAAAITHTRYYRDYYKANFLDSRHIFDLALQAGVSRIIYISSRAAVSNAGGYGETKLLAGEYLKTLPIEWVIYKPAEIFGGLKNEGIETLISDVLTKKRVIFPAGNEKMYPISLEDTARVIQEELFMPEAAGKTQILNGPEGFTYQEAIHLVMNLTHREVRGIGIPRFLMLLIKYILRLLPLHVGIVPDQIDRFYASKPHVFRSDIQDRLGDYILQVQQRSS